MNPHGSNVVHIPCTLEEAPTIREVAMMVHKAYGYTCSALTTAKLRLEGEIGEVDLTMKQLECTLAQSILEKHIGKPLSEARRLGSHTNNQWVGCIDNAGNVVYAITVGQMEYPHPIIYQTTGDFGSEHVKHGPQLQLKCVTRGSRDDQIPTNSKWARFVY